VEVARANRRGCLTRKREVGATCALRQPNAEAVTIARSVRAHQGESSTGLAFNRRDHGDHGDHRENLSGFRYPLSEIVACQPFPPPL